MKPHSSIGSMDWNEKCPERKNYEKENPAMSYRKPQTIAVLLLGVTGTVFLSSFPWVTEAANAKRFSGPQSSQPLAISADDEILAVANADNNTVSFFDIKHVRKFAEVPVQTEPNGVAVMPDGKKAFVANTVSGTVSVIKIDGK